MTAHRPSRRLRRLLAGFTAAVCGILLAPTTTEAHAATVVSATDVPVPPDISMTGKDGNAVTAADRDFVIRVRLAGLWEIPAGNMAQNKSNDPRIVKIGKAISEQHVKLDQLSREAAAQLRIGLPDDPTPEQQDWLNEMKSARGQTFDQIYIDRLRAAHGKIFPAIATIRAGTRNEIVRRLAQDTNQFVMTHMTLLESSGLVDYGSLPAPPPPDAVNKVPIVDSQALDRARSAQGMPGLSTSVILFVLAVAVIGGVITAMRIFRSR